MRNALIDIGSNTIRLVVYDGSREIENYADYRNLIADVSDGEISSEGIFKIISSLTSMKHKAESLECDNIYAFATASLRDIEDKVGLISLIKEHCGLEIEIISGEMEAYYDYLGLRSVNNITEGIAFDLGGGSCQIIVFGTDGVLESVSLPVGSLRIHTDFVSGILPDISEQEKISSHIENSLSLLKKLRCNKQKTLFAMGGAVFALALLSKEYFSKVGLLTSEVLEKICTLSEEQINMIVPKRLKTVIPAALTMLEILKAAGASEIIPTTAGVRDGILNEKFLKNPIV